MLQKFQTIVISLLSFLCLTCLLFFFWLKPELIQVQEVSELIPDQGLIDKNQALQLSATIYFVRQSFHVTPTSPHVWPLIVSFSLIGLGLISLFIFFKRWTKISWIFVSSGLALWFGIIICSLPKTNYSQLFQLIAEQINVLGIMAVISLTLLASAAIPQFIFHVGYAQTYQQSRKNWLILGGFYLVNLILSYGNAHLNWELGLQIPPILFGFAAWILFLWHDSKNPWLHIGLASMAIATIFSWVAMGNDAGIAAWEHWTLICQLIMVLLFPLFIFSNFQTPMRQNLPVYKITNKAPIVPLNLIFIGVCILGFAWVFARNGSAWHQAKAALSNQAGDVAWLFQDKKQAEFSYQNAMSHSRLNGQSSLRLANLAFEAQDNEAAAYYLSTSQLKHPTDASYVGLANIFQQENQLFQALFTLQKADQIFPNNLRILTQLAHTYESLQIVDSAQYFYQKAVLANEDNELAQANLLYALKENPPTGSSENPAIRANQLATKLKNSTFSNDTPSLEEIKPTNDLREWACLYNSMLFFKGNQALLPTKRWIEQGYANSIFPELRLLDAWQDYYHNKPLRALEKLSLILETDATGKLAAYKNIVDFWHKSMRMTQAPLPKNDLKSALEAIESYPFQADLLQESILILNANKKEKQAYEASLQAARWNEDVAEFQWIYALQALKMGEIDYAKEAMNHLFSLNQKLFTASKPVFDRELQQALARQKF